MSRTIFTGPTADRFRITEGIYKKIITPGTSRISEKPIEGSKCRLKIENVTRTYTVEDEDVRDLPSVLINQNTQILTGEAEVTMVIGEVDNDCDKQVERAVQLMKDNEHAYITITVRDIKAQGYPEHAELITFEATLLSHERFKPIWEWTPEEKYDIAMKYKVMGVSLVKDKEMKAPRFKDAFYRFSRACKILITLEPIDDLGLDDTLKSNIELLRLKLYNNMSVCQGKQHNYYHVIELCNKVLAKRDKEVQALLRRGYAYGELKDYERAVADFNTLLTIEPLNRLAKNNLIQYNSLLRQVNQHCNEMVKRMFKM